MFYDFPKIYHLDQIKAAIDGREEFIIAEREHYDVVNYMVRMEETFPPVVDENTALLRECRGLIFDKQGRLMSRSFHKFFNVNELEETALLKIPFDVKHVFLDKIDGSFVRPIKIDKYVRWATKMGITNVSMLAEQIVTPHIIEFAKYCIANHLTPIFEFISPRNRIVIDYKKEDMILLAVRMNETGEYLNFEALELYADHYGLNLVNMSEYIDVNDISSMTGIEGFVVRFDNGHMVKIKTEEYVMIHKAKDSIGLEKNVVSSIINEKIDDLVSILPEEDAKKLKQFNHEFWEGVKKTENEIIELFDDLYVKKANKDRKAFAQLTQKFIQPLHRAVLFSMIDGHNPLDRIIFLIKKNTGSQTNIDKVRSLWNNVKWNYSLTE
jgi:RNA ligase